MSSLKTNFPTVLRWYGQMRFPRGRLRIPGTNLPIDEPSLFELIDTAQQHRLPLAPWIDAFARDARGRRRWQLRKLAGLLSRGAPLTDGLDRTPHLASDQSRLAVRIGAECGMLPRVLNYLSTPAAHRHPLDFPVSRVQRVSLFLLLAILGWTWLFLQLKIFPTFRQIAADLETTHNTLAASIFETVSGSWPWFLLLAVGVLWLLGGFRVGRQLRWRLYAACIPSLRQLRSAEFLQHCSLAIEQDRPLETVISALARHHYDPPIRRKLLFLRNELEWGGDIWDCAQQAGFLSQAEAALLKSPSDPHHLAWVTTRLSEVKREQGLRAVKQLQSLFYPFGIVAIGVCVLLFCQTIFSDLAQLVLNLS